MPGKLSGYNHPLPTLRWRSQLPTMASLGYSPKRPDSWFKGRKLPKGTLQLMENKETQLCMDPENIQDLNVRVHEECFSDVQFRTLEGKWPS